MTQGIKLLLALAVIIVASDLVASEEVWQQRELGGREADRGVRHYRVDIEALRDRLQGVPHQDLGDYSRTLRLPMPDGQLAGFTVVESPVMHPDLASRYPQIRTFKLRGIDDPAASGRADLTPFGFHALLRTSQGRVLIDPDSVSSDPAHYQARWRPSPTSSPKVCGASELDQGSRPRFSPSGRPAQRVSGMLLQYRIAIAATEEYVTAVGGFSAAQAEIAGAVNRLNDIYEDDHGIVFQLVANNDMLIEVAGNAGFTNDDQFALLVENQAWIDSQIGSGAYDIGHVFATNGGGRAFLGVVCDNATKAQGVSGRSLLGGDPFFVDLVAHEVGHQFSAEHTFNGTTGNCAFPNRSAATAFEPGSGSSIMAYSGICGAENIQILSDPVFHAGSITQVNGFANGLGCGTQIATVPVANQDPVITAVSDKIIPVRTPFVLETSATDADVPAQVLTYQWDQMNVGSGTDATTFGTDTGDNPLFRSFAAQPVSRRDFPALGTQLQGLFDDAEVLPCTARNLNFRLTARDGRSGQDTEDVQLSTTTGAGPFRVTSHAVDETILASNGDFQVTWDVAGTDAFPVNCANVTIELLAFNNSLYSNHSIHTLVASTPNNGSATVPATADSLIAPGVGRLRVKCTNNVFYALSQGNLRFTGSNVAPQTFFGNNDFATFFNTFTATQGPTEPACGPAVVAPVDRGVRDATAVDYRLVLILLLVFGVRAYRYYGLQ